MVLGFGIVALVLTTAALASRVVQRWFLTLPVLFLGLGLVLGGPVTGVLDLGPNDPMFNIVLILKGYITISRGPSLDGR